MVDGLIAIHQRNLPYRTRVPPDEGISGPTQVEARLPTAQPPFVDERLFLISVAGDDPGGPALPTRNRSQVGRSLDGLHSQLIVLAGVCGRGFAQAFRARSR